MIYEEKIIWKKKKKLEKKKKKRKEKNEINVKLTMDYLLNNNINITNIIVYYIKD